ncbi:MAG: hypothetical protein GY749_45750 [Desulfobacteraceae bacterium]|nr:hypothetical protein [Desulfobacteraceae bacterium]
MKAKDINCKLMKVTFCLFCKEGPGGIFISLLLAIFFLTACAGPQIPPYTPPKTKTLSYNKAVRALGNKLGTRLNSLYELHNSPGKKSVFIYNKDVQRGRENELARRFIEELIGTLATSGIDMKRKKLATWGRATRQSFEVQCREVMETLKSDYLIEFSLRECAVSDCMEATVQIFAGQSNNILFAAKEAFVPEGNAARWLKRKLDMPEALGTRENPFPDYYEAANHMSGRLACIAKSMMSDKNSLSIIIGKTGNTPSDIALAFSDAVSFYGLDQVAAPDKWLSVVIRSGDRFEMGMFGRNPRELFGRANVVLAVDKTMNQGLVHLKAQLLTISSVEIITNGQRKIVKAGMALPYCTANTYVGRIISATGVGICNKDWDPELWQETAKEAARAYAMRNLAREAAEMIRTRAVYSSGHKIDEERMQLILEAVVRGARVVREDFDKDTCRAEVEMEVERENIETLLPNTVSARPASFYSQAKPARETRYKPLYTPVRVKKKNSIKAAYEHGQTSMLGDINSYIRERLSEDEILPTIINLISINGRLDLPDCQKEDHYLSPSSVPPRHYCSLNYDLRLVIDGKDVYHTKGRVRGMGSDRNTAWEDALLKIADHTYILVSDIAFTMSMQKPLGDLQKILHTLDESLWKVSHDFNDTDAVLHFIEKQIADLSR